VILYLILIASALCLVRSLLGPTAQDRVIAIDTFTTLFIVILVIFGLQYRQSMLLDIAIAFSILSFIGTLAIAKYLEGEKLYQ